MKTYISAVAILLCALTLNVKAQDNNGKSQASTSNECTCCTDCKDDKCKELCTQWGKMNAEEKKGDEGKKVKEECVRHCKEKKCCKASDKAACDRKDDKGCCSKK